MTTPRVLVIDDDQGSLQTTRAQLLSEPYELTLLSSGAAALGLMATPAVDLAICDLMMPEIDGVAVCRAFKAHPEWRYVPILLLTAVDAADALVDALEAGADTFVTKPVHGELLRARARAMLRVRQAYTGLRLPKEPDRRSTLVERARLTDREREVLDLLLLGRTHEDIATLLGISQRTSKFHQANLLQKLGAESRLDLMRLFL